MSQSPQKYPDETPGSNSVPGWIASGLLGLALGAGGGVLGMQIYSKQTPAPAVSPAGAAGAPAAGAPAGMAPGGMPGMGGGGPPMMGMGGMGGGMGGMMGGGGGGGKFALTSLVGRLELLSRPDLKLRVELNEEQAKAIAAKLAELDKAEKMTGDEAQEALDALEAVLTPEQKEVVNTIGLPRGGRGGGGGRGAGGRPGGGPPGGGRGGPPGGGPPGGGGMMGMGMGMGGGNPDENPFTQEANQKRLHDLLSRLAPESAEGSDKSP
jgi:hypothetical protein